MPNIVACGAYHTLVLKNDGRMYACGGNRYGQLGTGNTNNTNTFKRVQGHINPSKIRAIVAGGFHSMVLEEYLYGWGNNQYCQLGIQGQNIITIPTVIPLNRARIKPGDIKSVHAGWYHTIIHTKKGLLYGLGDNGAGQLGIREQKIIATPTEIPLNKVGIKPGDIKSVHPGEFHTIIRTRKDIFYGFGDNTYGQFGIQEQTITTPTKIPLKNIAAPVVPQHNIQPNEIKNVCAGTTHFVFHTQRGIYAVGGNGDGQLGTGDNRDRATPVLVLRSNELYNNMQAEADLKERIDYLRENEFNDSRKEDIFSVVNGNIGFKPCYKAPKYLFRN